MAHNTQYTRSRNHNIATGGTQVTTWAQIFCRSGFLLEKTTRLVPSRTWRGRAERLCERGSVDERVLANKMLFTFSNFRAQ